LIDCYILQRANPADQSTTQDPYLRWAEVGYATQIVLVDWMAASHKSLEGWLLKGSAVWMAFHIDIFAWPRRSTIPRLQGLGLLLGMHLGFLPVLKLGLDSPG
jgi:hypothetical protein